MNFKKLGFIYLPIISIVFAIIALVLNFVAGKALDLRVVLLIGVMSLIVLLGYRNRINR